MRIVYRFMEQYGRIQNLQGSRAQMRPSVCLVSVDYHEKQSNSFDSEWIFRVC